MTVYVRELYLWQDSEELALRLCRQVGDVLAIRERDEDGTSFYTGGSPYAHYWYRSSDGVHYVSCDLKLDDYDDSHALDDAMRMHDHCYRTTRSMTHEIIDIERVVHRGQSSAFRSWAKRLSAKADRRQGKRIVREAA